MSFRIIDWDKHYENSRSRKVEHLAWVSIPNKHDGEGYSIIMADERATVIFTAWILLVQVASKCQTRGELVRGDGTPMTLQAIATKTRAKVEWFEYAIPILIQVGWIQRLTDGSQTGGSRVPPECQPPTTQVPPEWYPSAEEQNRTERTEQNTPKPPEGAERSPDSVSMPEGADPRLCAAWNDWRECREERAKAKGKDRVAWTARSAQATVNQIMAYADSHGISAVCNRIEEAIAAGWRGPNFATMGETAPASGPTVYLQQEAREYTQEETIRAMGGDDECVERARRLRAKFAKPA